MKEIIIPIAIGILSSPVVTLIITWIQQKNVSNKRNQVLDQAAKRVAFLESWFKAQQLVRTPEGVEEAKEVTQRQLDYTIQKLSDSSTILARPIISYDRRPFLARVFLLFRPSSFLGWFVRVIFYLLLPFIVLVILGSAVKENEFSLRQFASNWKILFASLLVFIPIVAFMHWVAVHSELKTQAQGNAIDQLWIWEAEKAQSEPDTKDKFVAVDIDQSSSTRQVVKHRRTGLKLAALLIVCWIGSSVIVYKDQKLEDKAKEHLRQGQILESIGEFDAAVNEYGQALNNKPSYESYYGRGIGYTEKRQYNPAINDFTEALKLNPNGPDTYKIYFGRARAYEQKGSYDYALADYTKSIVMEPRNPQAYLNRGRILAHRLKRSPDALVAFEAAWQLDSKEPEISWELGEALVENDPDVVRAFQLLQACVEADKSNANYQASLGWALFRNGDSYNARRHLEDAIRMKDYSTRTYERLGDVYLAQGYNKSAIECWNNGLKGTADPSDQKRLRDKIAEAQPFDWYQFLRYNPSVLRPNSNLRLP